MMMLKNEIKSVLRNKNNKLYIIVFIFLFLILNFSFNLNIIIDKYYDDKMQKELEKAIEISKIQEDNGQDIVLSDEVNEEIKAMIEEYNDYLKTAKKVDIKVSDRMIRTSNGKELTEEQQQKIQNMKHVESLERHVEKLFSIEGLRDNTVYYILVDNWKNCAKVQKYLDSLGITSYVDLGTSTEIVENYQKVNNLANLIKYTVCGISLLIVYACCKNIIKNEKENTKLLHVLGYKNRKIKNILLIQLWMIAFVGAFIGYCISQILTFTGSYYLFKIPINVFFLNNFMIMVILIFLPTFILTRKLKMD